jgi:hypothetical protein
MSAGSGGGSGGGLAWVAGAADANGYFFDADAAGPLYDGGGWMVEVSDGGNEVRPRPDTCFAPESDQENFDRIITVCDPNHLHLFLYLSIYLEVGSVYNLHTREIVAGDYNHRISMICIC